MRLVFTAGEAVSLVGAGEAAAPVGSSSSSVGNQPDLTPQMDERRERVKEAVRQGDVARARLAIQDMQSLRLETKLQRGEMHGLAS